jgi:CheY-like chemotaxis protein
VCRRGYRLMRDQSTVAVYNPAEERETGLTVAKVLIVDDEPNIREVVGLYLRRDGHVVVSAADGEEALEVFRESEPDLVVLDLMLPRLSGLEVCRRMHAERRVALIILSLASPRTSTAWREHSRKRRSASARWRRGAATSLPPRLPRSAHAASLHESLNRSRSRRRRRGPTDPRALPLFRQPGSRAPQPPRGRPLRARPHRRRRSTTQPRRSLAARPDLRHHLQLPAPGRELGRAPHGRGLRRR